MPYIDQKAREELGKRQPENPGELNYVFTALIQEYVERKGKRYQTFNDVIGALEGAKLELYRRQVAEYENVKIKLNGDVYE